MLDGQVSEVLSVLEVVLEEVQERDIVGGHGHHNLVLLLESFEALDSLLDLLVFDEVDSFGDLHFGLNFWKGCSFEGLNHIIVASENVFLDEGSNELGSLADVRKSFFLFLLEVLLEWVQITNVLLLFVLELHELLLFFLVNTWDVNQEQALKPCSHLFFVSKCVQADDQVEADIKIRGLIHDVFIHLDCLAKALLLNKG